MDFSERALPNPQHVQVYINGAWTVKRLNDARVKTRIHRNNTRTCTRCLGSGFYFTGRCETCSGWGVNMILRGHNDIRRST